MSALDATSLRQWAYDQVDMAPHIDTLMRYAAGAKTVIEWGVRGGVSTWAILDAIAPDGVLVSVDIVDCVVPRRVSDDPRWTFIVGDDLDPLVLFRMPLADMVFIDTSHTYEQTADELFQAGLRTSRIVMHDFVMEPVGRAANEFCERHGWRVVDNELPYGLALLEPA